MANFHSRIHNSTHTIFSGWKRSSSNKHTVQILARRLVHPPQPRFRSTPLWPTTFRLVLVLGYDEEDNARYEEMKINIQSFRLFIIREDTGDLFEKEKTMVEEVIVKAIKMGTIDFEFEYEDNTDSNFGFVLPREVFGSKTLIRLSISGCEIDLGQERKVSCSGLKSLGLKDVEMESDTVWDIVSSCPSIENLFLQPGYMDPVLYAPVPLYQLHKLKSLLLSDVNVDNSFFSNLLSKFPFLKDLSVRYCHGYEGIIELSSRSLECISFTPFDHCHLRLNCDVPNIRKFRFIGSNVPSLSFKTASMEWESDITLTFFCGSAECYLKLNKLLDCLSLSRISLCIYFMGLGNDMELQASGKTVVEILKVHARSDAPPSNCLLLAKCLLQSCRPKIISEDSSNDFLQSVCNILIQGVSVSGSSVFVVQGLKGVDLDVVEESRAGRQPLLLGDSSAVQKIRCRLRWQPELSHSGDANMC